MYFDYVIEVPQKKSKKRTYKGTGGKPGREPGHGRWKKTRMYVPDVGLMDVPYASTGACKKGQVNCFECLIDPSLCKGGEY